MFGKTDNVTSIKTFETLHVYSIKTSRLAEVLPSVQRTLDLDILKSFKVLNSYNYAYSEWQTMSRKQQDVLYELFDLVIHPNLKEFNSIIWEYSFKRMQNGDAKDDLEQSLSVIEREKHAAEFSRKRIERYGKENGKDVSSIRVGGRLTGGRLGEGVALDPAKPAVGDQISITGKMS